MNSQLDELYGELEGLRVEHEKVLGSLRDLSTNEARAQLASIEGKRQAIWNKIRRRKAERSAEHRGEQVPRPPRETGLRKARWEE